MNLRKKIQKYIEFFLNSEAWKYFAQSITHYGVLTNKNPITFADEEAFIEYLKQNNLNINEVENIYVCYSFSNWEYGKTIVVKIYVFENYMFLVRSDKVESSQIPVVELWEQKLRRDGPINVENYKEKIIFEEIDFKTVDQDYDILISNKLNNLKVFNNEKMNDIFLFSNDDFFVERWVKHLAIKDFYSREPKVYNSLKDFLKGYYDRNFSKYSFLSIHQISNEKLIGHAFTLVTNDKIIIIKTNIEDYKTLILNKNINLSLDDYKRDKIFSKQIIDSKFSNWFFI